MTLDTRHIQYIYMRPIQSIVTADLNNSDSAENGDFKVDVPIN